MLKKGATALLLLCVSCRLFGAGEVTPKGGTTTQLDAYTGQKNEIAVDTSKHSLRIFDGYKKGGYDVTQSSWADKADYSSRSGYAVGASSATTAITASSSTYSQFASSATKFYSSGNIDAYSLYVSSDLRLGMKTPWYGDRTIIRGNYFTSNELVVYIGSQGAASTKVGVGWPYPTLGSGDRSLNVLGDVLATTGFFTYSDGSSANWKTAYDSTLKWNGQSTGLVQTTAKDSLGIKGFMSASLNEGIVTITSAGLVGIGRTNTSAGGSILEVDGNMTLYNGAYYGSGGGLTFVNAYQFDGHLPTYFQTALTAGTTYDCIITSAQVANSVRGTGNVQVSGSGPHFFQNGNVGIGTIAPTYPVHINTTAAGVSSMYIKNNAETGFGATSYSGTIGTTFTVGVGGGTSIYPGLVFLNTTGSSPIIFAINSIEKFRVDGAGNFGIGTPTATGKLQILTEGATFFISATDGNVGIGNIAPSQTLDVSGVISATGGTSTNWNTAYTDRLNWDGGSTGLTASTGRDSLGVRGFNSGYTSDNAVYITSGGNVGVGLTTPIAKLHVVPGNVGIYINTLSADTTQVFFSEEGGTYNYGISMRTNPFTGIFNIATVSNGTPYTAITINRANGNVGIGATNPAMKLDISGTTRSTVFTVPDAGNGAYGFGDATTQIYGGQGASGYIRFYINAGDRFKFNADGNAYADTAWLTFSPNIKKDPLYKDKAVLTGTDYLSWALVDAKKPIKPYPGIPDDKTESDKYSKDISKIAIGTARWAEEAQEKIQDLIKRIENLEGKAK